MKAFDDKWLLTLGNPLEESSKRYKALVSIKKYFKEQPEQETTYSQIINEHSNFIFYNVTERLSKYAFYINSFFDTKILLEFQPQRWKKSCH